MKRLVAATAVALAVLPLAGASAAPQRVRAVDCTRWWVIEETNPQRYLLCLNQR